MLIVVTIITILTAIIPRVNGIMERARDLQRVNGLRTIATALEAYKATHGHYPLREPTDKERETINTSWKYKLSWWRYYNLAWGTDWLAQPLQDYLKSIPRDPQWYNKIQLEKDKTARYRAHRWWIVPVASAPLGEFHYRLVFSPTMERDGDREWKKNLKFWYRYETVDENSWKKSWQGRPIQNFPRQAILVAKVETENDANFVSPPRKWWNRPTQKPKRIHSWNGLWRDTLTYYYIPTWDVWILTQEQIKERSISNLHLCESIKKVPEGEETFATAENKNCGYSSKDQLYYIIKLD